MTKIRCLFSMVNWEGSVPKELHLSTGCHACENLWGISHGPARPSVSAMAKPKLCNSSVVLEPASRVRSPSVRRGDRKSTRLNSSHVKISYAVFCLKKKKQYKIILTLDTTVCTYFLITLFSPLVV